MPSNRMILNYKKKLKINEDIAIESEAYLRRCYPINVKAILLIKALIKLWQSSHTFNNLQIELNKRNNN